MTTARIRKITGSSSLAVIVATAMIAAIAIWSAACSSKTAQAPGAGLASMQMSPAPAGSCQIDAAKMCQALGGGSKPAPQQASMPMASSYGPSNMPDSIEFQIPAGQAIKLMCYYDPQHASIYRADATPEAALTGNSVDYMKKQGFCINK
jgi:hypothetical protein